MVYTKYVSVVRVNTILRKKKKNKLTVKMEFYLISNYKLRLQRDAIKIMQYVINYSDSLLIHYK